MRWLGYCENNVGLKINIEQVFHFAHFDAETFRLMQHRCPVGRNSGETPYQVAEGIEAWLKHLEEALVDEIVEQEIGARLAKLSGWASTVAESDLILSFNYDTLAERALVESGKFWNHGITDDMVLNDGISVFKMHGSVDWMIADRRETFAFCDLLFEKRDANREQRDTPTGYVEDDCRLWRCKSRKALAEFVEGRSLQFLPENAPPRKPGIAGLGAYKELHAIPGLGEVWIRAMQAVHRADDIVIIGFQMSDFDAMAQLQFAASMMQRHKNKRSPRVTVIDPGASNPEFTKRFLRVFRDVRFIPEKHEKFDWSRLS